MAESGWRQVKGNRHVGALFPSRLGRQAAEPQGGAVTDYARFGSDAGAGITNTYDGFGRLRLSSSNLGGVTRTVASDYDAHGNRTRLTHPDGALFEYAYDNRDRLFHVSENGPSITLASIFYDAQGRRSELARDTLGTPTAYGYDPGLAPRVAHP